MQVGVIHIRHRGMVAGNGTVVLHARVGLLEERRLVYRIAVTQRARDALRVQGLYENAARHGRAGTKFLADEAHAQPVQAVGGDERVLRCVGTMPGIAAKASRR